MNSLNIDFRGESLRVLTARDGVLKHSLIVRNYSVSDPKKAKQQLTTAILEAGGKKGKVHAILPHNILKFGIFQVPAMDMGDALKVVRRDIAKDLGTNDFVIAVRRIIKNRPAGSRSDGTAKQDILAEYALKSDVQTYLTLLKQCGLKPSIVTTSLEGIIRSFNKIRPVTEGNEAVLEIGQHFIEIVVFNDGRLINYKKIQLPASDESKLSGKDMDEGQIFKIKMYSIVDALYSFILEMGSGTTAEKISRLWISGLGSLEKNTTEVLSESLGVNCMLINPFDTNVTQAGIYTALAGLSMMTSVDQMVNLIPTEERDKGKQLVGKTTLMVALACYAVLVIGGYTFLSRTEKDLRMLKDKAEAQLSASRKPGSQNKQQDALRKVMSNDKRLYPVFRDLANLTPPDITLTSLDVEKTAEATFIRLGASLQPVDEGLKKAAVSKFLQALETTGRIALVSPPEIVSIAAKPNSRKEEFMVKVRFEVLQ